MGHALNGSVQDTLIRYHRMQGMRTKWILGTDHAGIATQKQVEKALEAEGSSREELGREAFVERVWHWREEYGGQIIEQFKRLGATLDYDDERFTLDERYAHAVLEVFVALYRKGLIYRDHYLVNWDPGTQSAISDLEVEDREETDTLFHIAYPLEDGSGEVVVATVRPETMLADTAVAVNPDDERYRHLIGKTAILPLVGRPLADHRRRLRQDRLRHRRPEDHARPRPQRLRDRAPPRPRGGQRHRRGRPHDRGRRPRVRGPARRRGAGARRRRAARPGPDPPHRALHAHGPVQPPLGRAHRAAHLAAVVHARWTSSPRRRSRPCATGASRSTRRRSRAATSSGSRTSGPWCISRQLWWGHQIPVWYRGDEAYVGTEPPEGEGWERDPDVLDTWFSSGAVAVRDARLARADAGPAGLLPDRRPLDGARHPLPLGRADGDDGPRVHGRHPVRRRLRALGHPGARRAADEQVAGHRHRPDRRDRPPRRRRGALRPARDVLDPGREVLQREGPAGPARWRTSCSTPRATCCSTSQERRGRAAAADGLRPLDPRRGCRRRRRRSPTASTASTSPRARSGSTTSSTASCATGTSSSPRAASSTRTSRRRCSTSCARRSRSRTR